MTPYERLMAEAIPTGRFGGPRPEPDRRQAQPAPQWTPEEQAAHRAVLDAALDAIETRGPRHLRAVPDTDQPAA